VRKAIGARLKKAREDAGFTQSEVGSWVGLQNKAVSAWESGYSVPTATQLRTVALKFDASADDLLGIHVEMQQTKHVSDAIGEIAGPRKPRGRDTKAK
jgi:transcriptional regulator with XRE-family HTH domain